MPQWLKNQLTDINPAQPKGYFAKRGVQTWASATATIIRDNVNIDADHTVVNSEKILLGDKNARESIILGDKFLL